MIPLALLAMPFAAVPVVAVVARRWPRSGPWLAGAVMLACLGLVAAMAPAVFAGDVVRWGRPWIPAVDFALRVDGLALTFGVIVCGIGSLVVLYAGYYLSPDDPPGRFYATLLLFTGAMLGVVLAGNLVLLVVFWEATSIASFLLIGFWRRRADARQGARMALAVTGGGGLCLLAGVVIIGHVVGSYDLDRVLAAGSVLRAHPAYVPALLLVLVGAFTKSAQVPFHFWLPHAMAAPTPVSAFLHSATMVKAGVFLLARLYPALGGSDAWFWVVGTTGLVTLVFGAAVAIFQQDLKGLLAYSTISHLGLVTLLLGLDAPLAVYAGVFHIVNHAAFKASLFMAAGIIDHEAGSRDMRQLNGLWPMMPVTATLAIVASAAMAGVPLLNGFLSKEMFFAESLSIESHRGVQWVVPAAATLAGVLSVAYSVRFIHDVFFNGEPVGLTRTPHEPPRWMRVPVEALVVLCIVVGVAPSLTVQPLLAVAVGAVLGAPAPPVDLALWHGFNRPLAMSAIALAGGLAVYFGLQRTINLHSVTRLPVGGKHLFDAALSALQRLADVAARRLPWGRLQPTLFWLVVAVVGVAATPLVRWGFGMAAHDALVADGADPRLAPIAVAVFGCGVVAALAAAVRYRQRFTALVFIGVTGLMVSLAFVLLAAPDLALTQLLVEVVTVVLMVLVLHHLPQSAPVERPRWRRWRDALVASGAGLGIAAVAYAVMRRPFDSISPYYLAHALPDGGGGNVVNVVIVDFRGFDTMGEITVLAIAALVVHALLGSHPAAPQRPASSAADYGSLLLAVAARMLLPLATIVAIYLLLRGHNLPGGGFIAGLVLASAVVVARIAGAIPVVIATRLRHPVWIAVGLAVVIATGAGSIALGYPFLTSSFAHPVVPGLGEVPLATAALFDLGVFIAVVAASLLVLEVPARLGGPLARQWTRDEP